MKKILGRILLVLLLGSVLIALGFFLYARHVLKSTEPKNVSAQIHLPGLSKGARAVYDTYGVPAIFADTLLDAVRVQGYVVARDRLFQMDLIRRRMQGRLSELFGKVVVGADTENRFFGFTQVADEAVRLMRPEARRVLEAYAEGVNLWAKDNPSFEMRLLRYEFEPWLPRDSILVVLSMYQSLDHWENESETAMNSIQKHFPKPLADFLALDYGFLDAPLFNDPKPLPVIKIPGPEVFDLRNRPVKKEKTAFERVNDPDTALGSNGFLLSGKKTQSGFPILAGDPHLKINVPNIWYRLQVNYGTVQVTGATFVGIPLVVIGTNGKLAWTFTNANADTVDFVPLREGLHKNIRTRREKIRVRLGTDAETVVKETEWGPVQRIQQTNYAVQWAALDPKVLSQIDFRQLAEAQTMAEGIASFKTWAGPVQNCLLASHDGHIAWILVGNVPNRIGFDGRVSVERDATHTWNGYIPFSQLPKLIDPKDGVIANANQRTSPVGPELHRIANDFPSPARAYRIRELLGSPQKGTTESMAQVQLDTLSHTHLWYKAQLEKTLKKGTSTPWTEGILKLIEPWDAKLSVESNAYVFLREFRLQVFEAAFLPFADTVGSKEAFELFTFLDGNDAVLSRLLEEKPLHLLHAQFKDYDDLLTQVAVMTAQHMGKEPKDLLTLRWGKRNQARFDHVFVKLFPALWRWLSMPREEMHGDGLVPRVEKPDQAASLRMVVDLGNPTHALFSMPGGQSGHPFSLNYRDLFSSWVRGQYVGLFPAESRQTLTFF